MFLLIIALLCITITAQEKTKVTFEVIAPSLKLTDKIYIVGNQPEVGNWNPQSVEMESKGNYVWQKTISIAKGTRIEYKFTKGSWATEALGENGTVPSNSYLNANSDTLISKKIDSWRDGFNFKVNGQVTGKVIYHEKFFVDGLKPRDIFVWFPPNYDKNVNERYSVFYMHDGQNLVDPKKSNTFIDWQVDETADSLIRSGEVKPFIIVGINNTDDRSTEYSDTPLGSLYMKLIVENIKPFIDKNYRTLTDRSNTAVGGSSMGGLISFLIAWKHSDVFSKAACFSPAFKYRDYNYVKSINEYTGAKKDILFYIDNGGVGLESILQPGVDDMIATLLTKGYQKDKDLFVVIDKKAEHNEAAWAKRAWFPMMLFFKK